MLLQKWKLFDLKIILRKHNFPVDFQKDLIAGIFKNFGTLSEASCEFEEDIKNTCNLLKLKKQIH